MSRIPDVLHRVSPALVIILGGTNDLGQSSAIEILSLLVELHRLVLTSEGGGREPPRDRSLPVTIPVCRWKGINDTKRIEINAGIKLFADVCLRVPILDLGHVWTSDSELDFWSSDRVHFSVKGYDAIADMLYKVLVDWKDTGGKAVISLTGKPTSSGIEFLKSNKEVADALLSAVRRNSSNAFTTGMC